MEYKTGYNNQNIWLRIITIIEFCALIFILAMAFFLQFFYDELPCPLCLLQRIGFLFISFGILLNFRYGFNSSHYSIILLSALFTSFVALRQIVLHIVPGTGSYGTAIFGLHLYTWCYIIAMAIIIFNSIILGVDRQKYYNYLWQSSKSKIIINILFILLILLAVANLINIFAECGLSQCPDNPVHYI